MSIRPLNLDKGPSVIDFHGYILVDCLIRSNKEMRHIEMPEAAPQKSCEVTSKVLICINKT